MDLLVKNGRIVDPARKIDTVADIVIRDGKIGSIGAANVSGIPVFDATGLVVAPGFIDVATTREALTDTVLTDYARRTPVGRLGTVEELMEGIASLADNGFLNGVILRLDGGLRL